MDKYILYFNHQDSFPEELDKLMKRMGVIFILVRNTDNSATHLGLRNKISDLYNYYELYLCLEETFIRFTSYNDDGILSRTTEESFFGYFFKRYYNSERLCFYQMPNINTKKLIADVPFSSEDTIDSVKLKLVLGGFYN